MEPAPETFVIREPRVYLIGRQSVDDSALEAFLADHEVHQWSTDTAVAGEKLIEIAGRLCYLSFAKPRPGGNRAYIGHILEVGHGSVLEHSVYNLIITGVSRSLTHELVRHRAGFGYCLTGDTLVYSDHFTNGLREGVKKRSLARLYAMTETAHGRSRLKLLRPRCLDEQSGTFTQGRVVGVACSGIKPVFRVELEDGKTITCSKDHRFLTARGWSPLHEIVGGLEISPGGHAVYGHLDTAIMVNGVPAYKDKDWLEKRYCLDGLEQAQIAELAGVSKHTVRTWIRRFGLQKPLGSWTIGRSPWNKGKRYEAGWNHTEATRRKLAEMKRGELNPRWRGGITPEAVRIRRGIETLRPRILARDGYSCRLCHQRSNQLTMHHIIPIWASPELAHDFDNLASVCRFCHLAINGREHEVIEQFGVVPPDFSQFRPRRKGKGRSLVPRPRRITSLTYAGEQMTYDLEMGGVNHNFVANGIVTHNSQLSQRFVDESACSFVEPDAIAADPDLHRVWLEAVQACQRAYRELADGLASQFAHVGDRTLRRKMAREAARSVLPNATETKIFVTANARALRHFIEMRADPGADAEIRKVAVALLTILQIESPNLFGDYTLIDLPGGGQAATTAHRKV